MIVSLWKPFSKLITVSGISLLDKIFRRRKISSPSKKFVSNIWWSVLSDKNDFYNRQREEVSWNWKIQNIDIFGREKLTMKQNILLEKHFVAKQNLRYIFPIRIFPIKLCTILVTNIFCHYKIIFIIIHLLFSCIIVYFLQCYCKNNSQLTFSFSKSTIEALKRVVKYAQC